MAVLTKSDLNPFKPSSIRAFSTSGGYVSGGVARLSQILSESAEKTDHDIFLSHKFSDVDELVALYGLLNKMGFSVYVDWKDDAELDRSQVTPKTAARMRLRMYRAKCLFFATSSTSADSKWMPWELGFKDGQSGKVAICPVMNAPTAEFKGQEYLGIYPYVDKTGDSLWIHRDVSRYVRFEDWLKGASI